MQTSHVEVPLESWLGCVVPDQYLLLQVMMCRSSPLEAQKNQCILFSKLQQKQKHKKRLFQGLERDGQTLVLLYKDSPDIFCCFCCGGLDWNHYRDCDGS